FISEPHKVVDCVDYPIIRRICCTLVDNAVPRPKLDRMWAPLAADSWRGWQTCIVQVAPSGSRTMRQDIAHRLEIAVLGIVFHGDHPQSDRIVRKRGSK